MGDVEVSDDLIVYANDLFQQRYPSQQIAKSKEMLEDNRTTMLMPSILVAYDDLLIQLDNALWGLTNDHKASIGILAAASANSLDSRIFFHCNAPALAMLGKYTAVVREVYPSNIDDIRHLELGVEHLWKYEGIGVSFAPYEHLLKAQPAKNFTYPGRLSRHKIGDVEVAVADSNFVRRPDNERTQEGAA